MKEANWQCFAIMKVSSATVCSDMIWEYICSGYNNYSCSILDSSTLRMRARIDTYLHRGIGRVYIFHYVVG